MRYKVLLVSGSAQEPSLNERYLGVIGRLIEADDSFEIKHVSLRSLRLPMFLGYETSRGLAVERWREMVEWADGFVLACPEYDHALPAVFKNSFEHLDGKGFADKPVFLFGASTGRFGTVRSQGSVYPILRTYRAWLMPDELFIGNAAQEIDGHDRILDEGLRKRVEELSIRFMKSVKIFRSFRES